MPGDAAIYLETRAGRGAVLVFRTAAGGADAIGGKPTTGGDVRRHRLPIPPEEAAAAWQRMKRGAEQATRALGPRHRDAAPAAVAAALGATGLDPQEFLAGDEGAASAAPEPAAPAYGEQGTAVAAALAGGPDPLETVLLKGPETIGEDELRRVMQARMDLAPGDPRWRDLYDFETRHFAHAYGDAPTPRDETGRTLPPVPVTAASAAPPAPLATVSGEPLEQALERTVAPLARMADATGAADAVRGAQTGLNLLDTPDADGRRLLDAPLKVDGDPGPKTRAALTRAVARLGAAKVNEAIALGRLRQAAERAGAGTADRELGEVARQALAPLFRSPFAPAARAVENEVLQETLNALGAAPALAIDGDVGPKTEAAFRSAARLLGADQLTRRLADGLGLG